MTPPMNMNYMATLHMITTDWRERERIAICVQFAAVEWLQNKKEPSVIKIGNEKLNCIKCFVGNCELLFYYFFIVTMNKHSHMQPQLIHTMHIHKI